MNANDERDQPGKGVQVVGLSRMASIIIQLRQTLTGRTRTSDALIRYVSESANFVMPDNEWTQQDTTHRRVDGVTEEIDACSEETDVIH